MKIFTNTQIRQLDALTIEREPIASIDLMERAAESLRREIAREINVNTPLLVLAGPGNNGGDGLAIARMLLQTGYDVWVILLRGDTLSKDCAENWQRLTRFFPTNGEVQQGGFLPPAIQPDVVIVDALFGSGLSRRLEGIYKEAVAWINRVPNRVISIDLPSGLDGDGVAIDGESIVKADLTLTLQFPKLAMFFAENEPYIGSWQVVDIGLHRESVSEMRAEHHYYQEDEAKKILKKRARFTHKGSFGHALVWAGKKGMAGAAMLATKAAMRGGAGLVSVHSVADNRVILQTAVPEAIFVEQVQGLDTYSACAFGPGLGVDESTVEMLFEMLSNMNSPCVIDADALNIIARNPNYFDFIPVNSILTPHPREFDRLFGASANSMERIGKAIQMAKSHQLVIVLKGANTAVVTPDGCVSFNSTGNPGMAVGGMGDVLTGIILALLAQAYSSEESAKLGVYLHGLAGDLALRGQSVESLLPTDILDTLGAAFQTLRV